MATRSFARWPTEFKHDVAEELVIGLQASDNTKNNEMMLETVSKT